MTAPAPLRREVVVDAGPQRSFELFTAHIGAWWPLGEFGVFGADSIVAFEGDRLVERSDGRSSVWAEVLAWDPPHSLELAWHPGGDAERATVVRVEFTGEDDQTRVVLEHSGWERLADPEAAAREYGEGWPVVLGRFDDWLADRWFALMHRPGPALAERESIFANPAFGEHVAFLMRLRERGLLVAAGPLLGEDGAGMTVVRVRPEHGPIDVEALANEDDRCVAGGYLSVTVRPWHVRFSA